MRDYIEELENLKQLMDDYIDYLEYEATYPYSAVSIYKHNDLGIAIPIYIDNGLPMSFDKWIELKAA